METLTQKRLAEVLEYYPECGGFYWKFSGNKHFLGDEAGSALSGYVLITIDDKAYRAHRLAWFITHNEWPEAVHHINENPLDNRICNLQGMTTSEHTSHHWDSHATQQRRVATRAATRIAKIEAQLTRMEEKLAKWEAKMEAKDWLEWVE